MASLLRAFVLLATAALSLPSTTDKVGALEAQVAALERRVVQLQDEKANLQVAALNAANPDCDAGYRAVREEIYSKTSSASGIVKPDYRPIGKESIAVCVSGQIGRAMPQNMLRNLILANPLFSFVLFFNLQVGQAFFATANNLVPEHQQTMESFLATLKDPRFRGNWQLGGVKEHSLRSKEWLLRNLSLPSLDRIGQYPQIEDRIVNMLLKDEACAHQIAAYETAESISFDYVISTREDAYFFHEFHIPAALHFIDIHDCNLITKQCVAWDGINLRFSLLRRNTLDSWLEKRVWFYQSMYVHDAKVWNPEQLYLMQANVLKIRHCSAPVDYVPVAAARYKSPTEFCLILPEFTEAGNVCVPRGAKPFPVCSREGMSLTFVVGASKNVLKKRPRTSADGEGSVYRDQTEDL